MLKVYLKICETNQKNLRKIFDTNDFFCPLYTNSRVGVTLHADS